MFYKPYSGVILPSGGRQKWGNISRFLPAVHRSESIPPEGKGSGEPRGVTGPVQSIQSFSISRLAICPDISWKSESEILRIIVLLSHRLSTIKATHWWKHLRIDASDLRHKSRSRKQPWLLLCGGERYDRGKGWPRRKGRACGTWHCSADVQYSQQKGKQIPFTVLTSGTSIYLSKIVI